MKSIRAIVSALTAASLVAACSGGSSSSSTPGAVTPTRTIVMVWDGLRPDSINAVDTPNLWALRNSGVNFTDNHSTYPTFTMMNASTFATGSFPVSSGFYGNTFWTPPQGASNTIPVGKTASGGNADYQDPIYVEDYQILTTLNTYYGNQLLLVKNLFAAAQANGLVTATIGKSGAAYIQDLGQGGYFLDENSVAPRSLVTELQAAGYAIPSNTPNNVAYTGANAVTLASNNGNPTARDGYVTFPVNNYDVDNVAPGKVTSRDSTNTTQGAPENAANKYMLSTFLQYILPTKKPMLSVIWFRTPDNTQHGYGPNTPNAKAGLVSQDARLGELIAGLKANGMYDSTNIIVVSDHGHSTVSGPLALYPLRAITPSPTVPTSGPNPTSNAAVGNVDPNGYSFSGDVRSADLLTLRGFKAYDGSGCITSAMFGLNAAGVPQNPLKVRMDTSGTICGKAGTAYQAASGALPQPVGSFTVPAPGTLSTNGIVIAANGGSDYFYVPSRDLTTVKNLVKFLQQREEYGAIFVDSRYGSIPGTLQMAQVNLENSARLNNGQPDVVVSFDWDNSVSVQGLYGIEYESAFGNRGMHGSFGTSDVRNTLIASGPSFKSAITVNNPTGNVDVAPTVAYLLGTSMPQANGRILNEALANPSSSSTPNVTSSVVTSTSATGLSFELPTDVTGNTKNSSKTAGTYYINLNVKDLTVDGKSYRYFDNAKAVRN